MPADQILGASAQRVDLGHDPLCLPAGVYAMVFSPVGVTQMPGVSSVWGALVSRGFQLPNTSASADGIAEESQIGNEGHGGRPIRVLYHIEYAAPP